MRVLLKHLLVQLILLISTSLYAQVGIGTTTPDTSSALDVSSSSKGFLMPRLTTTERDNITLPATGLMIFNTTLNDSQLNTGTSLAPSWIGVKEQEAPNSATDSGSVSTTSTSDLLVPGMTLSPTPGTYIVLFNGQQITSLISTTFSSDQGVIDVNNTYQQLMDYPGGVPHAFVFGAPEPTPEVLLPGVYDVTGAISTIGTLVLDGDGDPNSIFIFRGTAAFATGASTIVELINGASSNNIFWAAAGAMSTGAGSSLKGTLISDGAAVSLGPDTDLEGRMLTKAGAISMGSGCVLTVPSGDSPIDLGVLFTLAMFTSIGAITDTGTCETYGDVGTALGAVTMLGIHVGEVYPPGTTETVTTTTAHYSIYQNGLEIVNSSRPIYLQSSVVSLQATANVSAGDLPIEIRWKVDTGEATIDQRTLSLIRSGY